MTGPRAAGTVRTRLLDAADALFYAEGVHSVGIGRVLEQADVAKASLYSTFGSKDELVRAYLVERGRKLRERVEKRVEGVEGARAKILAVFDLLSERMAQGSFRGCPFVNACAEGPPGPSPAREEAALYRGWRSGLFARLARDLGVTEPLEVGQQLSLLYDGALVGASMDSDRTASERARALATLVIDAHTPRKAAAASTARSSKRRRPTKTS